MINIPFNFQPESVSVQTGSYTIPTGKYAYVAAHVENGGTFTIGGATALSSEASVAGSIIAVNQSTPLTVAAGYIFEGQASGNPGVGSIYWVSNLPIRAASGQTISFSGSGSVSGYQIRPAQTETNVAQGFWLPAGTIINGTGSWRATVSIFNEIS